MWDLFLFLFPDRFSSPSVSCKLLMEDFTNSGSNNNHPISNQQYEYYFTILLILSFLSIYDGNSESEVPGGFERSKKEVEAVITSINLLQDDNKSETLSFLLTYDLQGADEKIRSTTIVELRQRSHVITSQIYATLQYCISLNSLAGFPFPPDILLPVCRICNGFQHL